MFFMNILLTNDDGLSCDGIHALIRELKKEHQIFVVAPDRNRSGVSNGITMTEPLCIKSVEKNVFTCSGLPVDCVITALRGLLGEIKIDVVISGINKGANLGSDILYSGTASAARQAILLGTPGIAVSLVTENEENDYEPTAKFISQNIKVLMAMTKKDFFVNVNTPKCKEFHGVKFTSLSNRLYSDKISLYNAPDGFTYSFFLGGEVKSKGDEKSDAKAVEDGFVSVSKVFVEPSSTSDYSECDESAFVI